MGALICLNQSVDHYTPMEDTYLQGCCKPHTQQTDTLTKPKAVLLPKPKLPGIPHKLHKRACNELLTKLILRPLVYRYLTIMFCQPGNNWRWLLVVFSRTLSCLISVAARNTDCRKQVFSHCMVGCLVKYRVLLVLNQLCSVGLIADVNL